MSKPDYRSRRRFLKESSMLGLVVAFSPGTIGEAFAYSKFKTAKKGEHDDANQCAENDPVHDPAPRFFMTK